MDATCQKFPDILKSIQGLKELMQCINCEQHMNSPVTLWSCNHVFCENCLENKTVCPKCNLPTWPEDTSKNRRLHNISLLCSQIESSLNRTASLSTKKDQSSSAKDSFETEKKNVNQKEISTRLKRPKSSHLTKTDSNSKRKRNEKENCSKKSVSKIKKESKGFITPKTKTRSFSKNVKGETLLHIAAMSGDLAEVEKCIKNINDVNTKDNAGWTPLHEACNQGHVAVVEKLLNAGALIDIPGYENDTPLIDAVNNNRIDVVKLLLNHGANVYLRNSAGKTAVELAQTSEMRSIISEYLTSQSLHPKNEILLKTKSDNIKIAFSSSINLKKVKSLCRAINASLAQQNVFKCSHLILPYNDELKAVRSLKYLQAMAVGAWIVNEKWIEKCLDSQSWVNELSFQIKGCYEDTIFDGPLRSRKAKLECVPRLFDGCHFFLSGRFSSPLPSKQQLIDMIKEAGGIVLNREPKPDNDIIQSCQKVPYHACPDTPQFYFTYYIIYDPSQKFLPRSVRLGKVCTVSASWVLDCVSQFKICDLL